MADQKSTGEVLHKCPVCATNVLEIDDNRYACPGCKRIWYYNYEEGIFISEVRLVRLTRKPQEGDSADSFIEPVPE